MNGVQPLKPTFRAMSGEAVLPVQSKADRVLSRCEAHFEKHRDAWVAKRYQALLVKDGAQPALRPVWAVDDRKSHLYRAASLLVEQKQRLRVLKIGQAAQRMNGRQRANDVGLG